MIRSKDILSCLPLLASVLGEQYGVQVHIGGKTACTNGRVIYLPSLPVDCEPELLALARGFVDHEAAHIRHNDTKSGEKPRFFTWLLMPTCARISANLPARLLEGHTIARLFTDCFCFLGGVLGMVLGKQRRGCRKICNPSVLLVGSEGLEPPAPAL